MTNPHLRLLSACLRPPPRRLRQRADPARPALNSAPPQATLRVEVPAIQRPGGETPAWWYRDGAAQAAERGAMAGRAKNVIVFLGDGMSLPTVAAARILEGQRKGGSGEENRLAWEDFPATALSKTYNTDSQTPDSAGTMTAITTGVKIAHGRHRRVCRRQERLCRQPRQARADLAGAGRRRGHGHRHRHHHAHHPCHPGRHLRPRAQPQLGERRRRCPPGPWPKAARTSRSSSSRPPGAGAARRSCWAAGARSSSPTAQSDPQNTTTRRGLRRDGRDLVAAVAAAPGRKART